MTAQQPPRLLQGIPLAVRKLQKTFGSRQVLREIDLHIPACLLYTSPSPRD